MKSDPCQENSNDEIDVATIGQVSLTKLTDAGLITSKYFLNIVRVDRRATFAVAIIDLC